MSRTTSIELIADGRAALVRALNALGHQTAAPGDHGGRALDVIVDGIAVPVAIAAAAVITPGAVARIIAANSQSGAAAANIAVGDLITRDARAALRDAGWGWLDRRGHLVLRATGVHIDAEVPPDARMPEVASNRLISGTAAVSYVVSLLLAPDDPPSMREVARRVSMSHSAIVVASKRLKHASLVRSDGRPLIPELFWALAEEWLPERVPLAHLPSTVDEGNYGISVAHGSDDQAGWVVGGSVAAAAWGAPVAIRREHPPDFYVGSREDLRQARLRLGAAERFDERACTVAIAPTPLVTSNWEGRDRSGWGRWRFAHGLFAALDLAQDRSRGAEILADWSPEDFKRVW